MRDDEEANSGELMWNGWILNPDGTIHAAEVIDAAVLPGPRGVRVRVRYAFTRDEAAAGRARTIQFLLDRADAKALAYRILDSADRQDGGHA